MSIFEPIPRESRWDDDAQDVDEAEWHDAAAPNPGFDPRAILIAGVVLIAIVVAGLVASNAADPASRPQPLVPARVNPGAAAVEQVEAKQTAPTAEPSTSVAPVDEADGEAQGDDGTDGAQLSGDSKWDSKPGRGKGKGHGHG